MIHFIEGEITEISAAHVVIKANGVGFFVNISLQTYSKIKDSQSIRLLTHLIVKEDGFTLFGFADELERHIFRLLISVSGVGSSTARVILSSLSCDEIYIAISQAQANVLQKIKGIGEKTAQRIIVDLKDKISKDTSSKDIKLVVGGSNRMEAIAALGMLGFVKNVAEKAVDKIIHTQGQNLSVEELVKQALKIL